MKITKNFKNRTLRKFVFLKSLLKILSSLYLTVVCLLGVVILVFLGTIEQVSTGIYVAQEKYFYCWFVYWNKVPVFPGGYFFAVTLFLSILSSIFYRFRFRFQLRELGILIIHLGLAFFIFGEMVTGAFSVESRMELQLENPLNYLESFRGTELVFVDSTDPHYDQVVSIPQALIKTGKVHPLPHTSLKAVIRQAFPNAKLKKLSPDDKYTSPIVVRGNSENIHVQPLPLTKKDNEIDFFTAYVEVIDDEDKSLGTWLLSNAIPTPEILTVGNQHFSFQIRQQRSYLPFSVQLTEFIHEVHHGTNIPKNFSSKIRLYDAQGEFDRSALIAMNVPLYYKGRTFYQASYGKNDTISILQVVKNPGKFIPYLSSFLVSLGLFVQFFSSFFLFLRRRQ